MSTCENVTVKKEVSMDGSFLSGSLAGQKHKQGGEGDGKGKKGRRNGLRGQNGSLRQRGKC